MAHLNLLLALPWHIQSSSENLCFEDDILQPTCFAIVGVIPLDQFERKLRRFLRSLSADLLQEAKNVREREAAKFVKLRSRNAAHLTCDELNATRKLFKEKQNAAPRAWEQSSDSDLKEDEDGTADVQDLGWGPSFSTQTLSRT